MRQRHTLRQRERKKEKGRRRERERESVIIVTWQATAKSVERLFRLTGMQQGQPKVVKDF
jgi:hypothetical protein